MKKTFAFILISLILIFTVPIPTTAAPQYSFVLTAATAKSIIIEPVYIPYTSGQSIKEALLSSEHDFVG